MKWSLKHGWIATGLFAVTLLPFSYYLRTQGYHIRTSIMIGEKLFSDAKPHRMRFGANTLKVGVIFAKPENTLDDIIDLTPDFPSLRWIVQGGANDLLAGRPREYVAAQIGSIITSADTGVVYVLGLHEIGGIDTNLIGSTNYLIKVECARTLKCHFVDMSSVKDNPMAGISALYQINDALLERENIRH